MEGSAIIDAEDAEWRGFSLQALCDRKAALRKLVRHGRGIQYVEHAEGHGDRLFEAGYRLGLEGIVSKSGCALNLDQNQKPKARAATRAADVIF